jgi:hypothetical protein
MRLQSGTAITSNQLINVIAQRVAGSSRFRRVRRLRFIARATSGATGLCLLRSLAKLGDLGLQRRNLLLQFLDRPCVVSAGLRFLSRTEILLIARQLLLALPWVVPTTTWSQSKARASSLATAVAAIWKDGWESAVFTQSTARSFSPLRASGGSLGTAVNFAVRGALLAVKLGFIRSIGKKVLPGAAGAATSVSL